MKITVKEELRKIGRSSDSVRVFYSFMERAGEMDRDKEHFWVLYLDTKLKVKCAELVSLGTLDSSLVHPREIFKKAIVCSASAIIVAHNHPSGDTTPSQPDRTVTFKLKEAGMVLGINMLDHIIIGREPSDGSYSFAEDFAF